MKNTIALLTSLGLLFGIIGCATVYDEQTLSAAGFKMVPADTQKKQANLKELQAYQVVPHTGKSGAVNYVYADPRNNRIYVGDQLAYERYQLKVAQQETNMDEMDEMDALDGFGYDDAMFGWAAWGMEW